MNLLNLFTKTYARLHNYKGIPYWMLSPARRLMRNITNRLLPRYLDNTHIVSQKKVIVSFTSFPARINNVWQVVECLFRQTYQPYKIILWLSREQFPDMTAVPASLLERQNDCFEIRLVDGDIRSHKKYYYAFQEFHDNLIFLVDDDLYYPSDMLENAMKARRRHPGHVISRYGYIMRYEAEKLLPYKAWTMQEGVSSDPNLFFGSGGGTLLEPASITPEILHRELFLKLTPQADDIWLNAMVRLSNFPIYKIRSGLILPIYNKDNVTLASSNLNENKNDEQIERVIDHFTRHQSVNPFEKR